MQTITGHLEAATRYVEQAEKTEAQAARRSSLGQTGFAKRLKKEAYDLRARGKNCRLAAEKMQTITREYLESLNRYQLLLMVEDDPRDLFSSEMEDYTDSEIINALLEVR